MLPPIGDDVESILECFEDLKDPRSHVNRKHLLGDLIVIAICAVIAGAEKQEVIATDGKALRRSHDHKHNLGALFLVSAWSVEHGVSLGQLATEEKSNEITAIPELINNIDVGGAIVTIDAAGCQKTIAAKIVAGGGDYVLALQFV